MPATSQVQYRLMEAAKHNPEFAKRVGISQSVADEFTRGVDYKSLPKRKGIRRKALR